MKPPPNSGRWPPNSTFPVDNAAAAAKGQSPSRGLQRRSPLTFLRTRPLARAFAWGLVSALALPPVHLLPVLLFSIPAFLTLIDEAASKKRVMLLGWMFGFGLNLGGLYWITEPILTEAATFWWLVPFAAPLLAFAVAFYTIIPALAARCVKNGFGRLLVFAGAWVVSNLIQQFAFSGFPWNFWGTDWVIPGVVGDVFIQPAALFSVHGLTLLTVILAGLPLFGRRGFVGIVLVLLAWGGFGMWRLQIPVQPTGVTLALVQPDFPVPGSFDRAALVARWQRLLAMSSAGLHAGATAVVWPEAASPWYLDSDAGAREALAAVTGTAPILAGAVRWVSNTDYRNSLVVTAGPGPALAVYDKWKLVPFGEYTPKWIPVRITPNALGGGFTPGPGPATLHVSGLPPFGPAICYEDVFPGQIVDEKDRPSWLLNITDDAWFGDSAGPRQHFDNARLRAVEEGLPLARDANSGITAMINAFGHVEASLPLKSQGVLVEPLPGKLPPTLFSRLGLSLPIILSTVVIIAGTLISIMI
jgi:apolipoprotein N-acyltransferase